MPKVKTLTTEASVEATVVPAPRKRGRPRKKPAPKKEKYQCTCCAETKLEDQFYVNKASRMWKTTKGRVLICKDCVDTLFKEYSGRYGEKTACIIMCSLLDFYFNPEMFQSMIEKNSYFNMGMIARNQNIIQCNSRTFLNSLVQGELFKAEDAVRETRESYWSMSDKRNKKFCLQTCGYDPLDLPALSDADRKSAFNILAGYLDCEGINEDAHKMQSCISITLNTIQSRNLDILIAEEQSKKSPDPKTLSSLTATKKDLQTSISSIVKDNNISSAYSKKDTVGQSTLSGKLKQMMEDGFDEAKVNLFDIKTTASMKQIADLSNQSILEQLQLGESEYTSMIAEQRVMIDKLQNDYDEVVEELRLLKVKIASEEAERKKKK